MLSFRFLFVSSSESWRSKRFLINKKRRGKKTKSQTIITIIKKRRGKKGVERSVTSVASFVQLLVYNLLQGDTFFDIPDYLLIFEDSWSHGRRRWDIGGS